MSGRPLFTEPPDEAGRIPGGCDTCDAFQVMVEQSPGVYVLTVNHDDECPVRRAHGEGRN